MEGKNEASNLACLPTTPTSRPDDDEARTGFLQGPVILSALQAFGKRTGNIKGHTETCQPNPTKPEASTAKVHHE